MLQQMTLFLFLARLKLLLMLSLQKWFSLHLRSQVIELLKDDPCLG